MIRRLARGLLLVYAFAVPWEYSLDLGEPLGNIARLVGLLLLLITIPAILESGGPRRPGAIQWAVLALYLYFCCTALWTIDPTTSIDKIRSYFQTMMIVWLIWELAEVPRCTLESPPFESAAVDPPTIHSDSAPCIAPHSVYRNAPHNAPNSAPCNIPLTVSADGEHNPTNNDMRNLLRALVAGSWILALLTVVNFASPNAQAAEQIRFVAEGQDPNDVARFLNISFPLAALLFRMERSPGKMFQMEHSPGKNGRNFLGPVFSLLAISYLPFALFAVLLTASRGGLAAVALSLLGSLFVLAAGRGKRLLPLVFAVPGLLLPLWFVLPAGVVERLLTLPSELASGNLNERLNIWSAGWQAFHQAPWFGSGIGTFVSAAHLAHEDTAHNTPLTLLVTGGLIALMLSAVILALAGRAVLRMRGPQRLAFATSLAVLALASFVGTVEENRITWLLVGLISLGGNVVSRPSKSPPVGCESSTTTLPQTSS